jgi:capsular exopolysaccharide synthesis family protein
MPAITEQQKIDFRVYIGILFFHWQIITICFLYCLLAGVLYINLAPKQYLISTKVMIYRDPLLDVSSSLAGAERTSFSMHTFLLQNEKFRERAAKQLTEKWGDKMGNFRKMILPVSVDRERGFGSMLNISVKCNDPDYGTDFLNSLLNVHSNEWRAIQLEASESASRKLTDELAHLEDKIKAAEDDVIEYKRLNDVTRVEGRASTELRYLQALMERRSMLSTELMLLEAENPALKGQNPGVISDVANLTRETGAIEPIKENTDENQGNVFGDKNITTQKAELPLDLKGDKTNDKKTDDGHGWRDLRVKLLMLQQKEKELTANLKPEHPELKRIRDEIADLKNQLNVASEIELGRMKDRYEALKIHMNTLEAAEYKWKAQNLLASTRQSELKRISDVVERFEANYRTLYTRLQDMKVQEELKAEHFYLVEPPINRPGSVWPDPIKVLIVVVALGLGSGLGVALISQLFDNKIQSISDVEKDLGIKFLGGIPFWVHSGLEKTIRPIVTEEHSTGAIEAYRALRTTILSALTKENEKIVMITSADSREGKTLTALNLAILIAQMDKKVLLIDMDLRRGRLHRSLGLEKEPGVTDVLKDGRSLRDVVVKTRITNLYLVPTGSTIEDSAEILQSASVGEIFASVQDDYDYILVDTSPILRVTDTVILATKGVGVVLYVARVNHTPKPMIKYSLDMLKDARVLGLIMNSIEMHKISSLYYAYQYPNYAYYSNAYAYGYDYYYYGDRHSGGRKQGYRRSEWDRRKNVFGQWIRRTFLPTE